VEQKADGSALDFNPPAENASLSDGPDARHACVTQHLTLLARPPTRAGNNHHPLRMLLVRGEYGPYSSLRLRSVERVVAKGHARWIRRPVADVLQLSPASSTER
jgi:hypothetical protein